MWMTFTVVLVVVSMSVIVFSLRLVDERDGSVVASGRTDKIPSRCRGVVHGVGLAGHGAVDNLCIRARAVVGTRDVPRERTAGVGSGTHATTTVAYG
jgi:hypothetical protein